MDLQTLIDVVKTRRLAGENNPTQEQICRELLLALEELREYRETCPRFR